MPWGEIKHAIFLSDTELEVTGTLDLEDVAPGDIQGTIPIRFLLMQEKPRTDRDTDEGSFIVNGDLMWDPAGGGTTWTTTRCAGPFNDLQRSRGGDKKGRCRGIAQASLVRNQPGKDPSLPHNPPPAFDTITWCVTMEIHDVGESAV